ncbi:hypothetical protein ABG79_02084 [Caloramator mitchellensis]|uniref:Uncharacterized protein n=1 Tax=Caloramator mitchellensis TaxID=908809 RepID=A0A0R3JRP9_CALMK|nr:hypothetical protein [Caloramator mitchellensis]KRQ86145.1 hypothetical protein ABG79_02084 [Caloramator mitchellensis]
MKPSRFSRDYYKIMRRRRVNLMLFILLIISIFYFFGDRIFALMNINIKIPKISFNFPKIEKKAEEKKQENNSNQPSNQTVPEDRVEYKKVEYTKADGKIIEILIDASTNKIFKLNDTSERTNYVIDKSKDFIVFDDIKAGQILMCDVNGNIAEISQDYYRSKSLNKNLYRKDILKYKPEYIWAAKPFITNDNRVIYISQLPYFKSTAEFYLWSYDLNKKETKRIGTLGTDKLELIEYMGYEGTNLKIKVGNAIYKLSIGSNKLSK